MKILILESFSSRILNVSYVSGNAFSIDVFLVNFNDVLE